MRRGDLAMIESGYRYTFRGIRNWRRASDEYWDTTVGGAVSGKYLGDRYIDGRAVR